MLSDEEKTKIREEEEIRMEVRKTAIHSGCCRPGGRLKLLGIAAVILLLIVVFCHHGHDHYYQVLPETPAAQTGGS